MNLAAVFLLSALLPDCRKCGHVAACHMTGLGHCVRRSGWRRKRCPCQDYTGRPEPEPEPERPGESIWACEDCG